MPSRLHLDLACHALAAGGVVAYPTEAVWGLGCDPLNRHAVKRILDVKRRAAPKGLIVIASELSQVEAFFAEIPSVKLAAALKTWPGPHTWLVPAAADVPRYLTGGRDTLAVRVTAHSVAAALCAAYGGPLVSTSANRAGCRPARTALQVQRWLGTAVDYILPGEVGGLARPTPIRDLMTGKLLRS